MAISETDKQALRAPDVLHAYCRATLGEGKRVGRLMFYPCPYGAHTRPKLEVAEKDGDGVCLCRACNQGGDVFNVAAGVLGLDIRKDFEAVAKAVADAVGYVLRYDSAEMPRKGRRKRKTGFFRTGGISTRKAISPAVESRAAQPLEYRPPDEEAAALDAVERLRNTPGAIARFASELNLPAWIIHAHTDIQECASLGLLGIDWRERLLYVYTHTSADSGRVRVLGVKTRNPKGSEHRFLMRGKKQALWGADFAAGASVVIMAEGESDALAVRASCDAWEEQERTTHPADFPLPDELPAIVARPDAKTFLDSWARAYRGKRVILLADNDGGTGEKGAKSTAEKLKNAGVLRVHIWTPPPGAKDARDVYDAARPWALFESIISDNIEQ